MSNYLNLLAQFKFKKILKNNISYKSLIILGEINHINAIISIEKSHFNFNFDLNFNLKSYLTNITLISKNDSYYFLNVSENENYKEFTNKLSIIYPASDFHIQKHSEQKYHYVVETPDMYKNYVSPYIKKKTQDKLNWINNIMFNNKEKESIIFEDKDTINGFVLAFDSKWDRISLDSLYLCCILRRCDIQTVRDLRKKHLFFLSNLQINIKKIVYNKYSINPDELRIFVHYQPTYYHLHLHVVRLGNNGILENQNIGKAILLDDVIQNIKIKDDFYLENDMHYLIGEESEIWKIEGFKNDHYSYLKRQGLEFKINSAY